MPPFLSICIPTYNRGEIVYRTVQNCLKYNSDRIEVVVSDNCSEDNTEELLFKIKDDRFKYFKNEYNNGFENLISVLTYGSGDYLLLTSDEDDVLLENLDKLIKILEKEEPAILIGGASLKGKPYITHRNGVYSKGFEAIRIYGSGCDYMSGYVYCKRIMDKVLAGLYGVEMNRRFGYAFCFTNLAREMLQYGNLSFREEILTNQREVGKRDMGALFKSSILGYSPRARMDDLKEKIDSLARTNLSEKEKYIMCKYYTTRDVLFMYIGDYRDSFDTEMLSALKNEEDSEKILEYYLENQKRVVGNQIYTEIEKGIKECEDYINQKGMFRQTYESLKEKYPDIYLEYEQEYNQILKEFKQEKSQKEGTMIF